MGSVERFLVVGLGNPGPGYAKTRHNAGFRVLDRLAEEEGLVFREKSDALLAEWDRGWLMKPLTYMNLSGRAVAPFVRKKGIPLDRLLVVHDDLDLPLGKIRLKRGGSSGGQRGVASIIESLGDDGFDRLRIGIGRPPPGVDAARYVLSPFTPEEEKTFAKVLEAAADAVRVWKEEGLSAAQSRFNGLDLREEG